MTSLLGQVSAPNIMANFKPTSFTSPGSGGTFSGGSFSLNPSAATTSAVGNLSATFGSEANAFSALAGTVQPGFSQLRQAGLSQLRNTQRGTLSNLSSTLAQRKILGSSFANSAVSESNANYAENKANFVAQSYLQELQASTQLTQAQYTASAQQFSTQLNQLNLDTELSASISTSMNSVMANLAAAQGQLDLNASEFSANSLAGLGKAAGTVLGLGTGGGTTIGGGLFTSLFSGGGGGGGGTYEGNINTAANPSFT